MQGDAIIAGAITEPNAGSDVTMVETRAVKDGDEYVINGTKMFITNGSLADVIIVFCMTNPEAENRHRRFSCFILETDSNGFEANKLKNKLGIRASDTAELTFNNIRVPAENLIGEEGDGFRQILTLFNRERDGYLCPGNRPRPGGPGSGREAYQEARAVRKEDRILSSHSI